MATIKDVARAAGVSFKTVSRVINGEKKVSVAVRARVFQVIGDLKYRPNLAAKRLSSKRSRVIALVVPSVESSYIMGLIIEVARQCRRLGYHLVTETVDVDADPAPFPAGLHASFRPDGIIVAPPFADHEAMLAAFEAAELPLVRIEGLRPGYGLVIRPSGVETSQELVNHLLMLGHRRIGMIAPPDIKGAPEERILGYRRALEAAGLPVDPDLIVRGNFSFASGANAIVKLLAVPERPTAVFATSDAMALGAMAMASRLGFRIPRDLAVAGYDNSPEGRMVYPQLTTIDQKLPAIARAAVEAAIFGETSNIEIRPELVIRGSTSGDRDLELT